MKPRNGRHRLLRRLHLALAAAAVLFGTGLVGFLVGRYAERETGKIVPPAADAGAARSTRDVAAEVALPSPDPFEELVQAVRSDGELGLDRNSGEMLDEAASQAETLLPRLLDALRSTDPSARLAAAAVLERHPMPAAVPALITAVHPVGRARDQAWDSGQRHERCSPSVNPIGAGDIAMHDVAAARHAIRTLGAARGARAVPLLVDILQDCSGWEELDRAPALYALGSIGTPDALAAVDAWRADRARRPGPWLPAPIRRPDYGSPKPMTCSLCGFRCRESAMFNEPAEVVAPDGPARAFVSCAAGGPTDLWLTGLAQSPLLTEVRDPCALALVSVDRREDAVTVTLRRGSPDRDCLWGRSGLVPAERVTLDLARLRADTDHDGWTDLLEQRLHTDPTSADTDGDTLRDPSDPAPRGKGPDPSSGCTQDAALVAAFFGWFAFAEDDMPLFVAGSPEVNLQYDAYPGPVVYLSPDEAHRQQQELGKDGATYVRFGSDILPAEEKELVKISGDGSTATVFVDEFRGGTDGVGGSVQLRCINGRWYPVGGGIGGVS